MSDKATIKAWLESKHSKETRDEIVAFVGTDSKRMEVLMSFFLGDEWEWRYNQRAAWPIGVLGIKHPHLLQPYHSEMIKALDKHTHDAVLRNIVRIYEDVDIPESIEGELCDRCFKYLQNPKYPIAVRCFSITILGKIALKYPEIKDELVAELKEHLPHGSAGFKHRAKKWISKLDILSNGV